MLGFPPPPRDGPFMRRAVLIITVLLLIGLLATVVSAWACATWSQPTSSNVIWLAGVRREFFDKTPATYTSWPSNELFVAFGHYGFGTQFLDVAVGMPDSARVGPGLPSLPRLNMLRAGWPWLAMEGWMEHDATRVAAAAFPPTYHFAFVDKKRLVRADRLLMERMIPLRPIWPGFVLNWAFWSLTLGLFCLTALLGRRSIRHVRRQCLGCGYPIGTSPVCTECGRRVSPRVSSVVATSLN
jgi:hypothetical protein